MVQVRSSYIMRLNSRSPLNGLKIFWPVLRFTAGAGLCVVFLLLIWNAGRSGLSSLLSNYGASTNHLEVANAAVNLSPNDPESHYLRATVLEANREPEEAIKEYRQAASLRPDDYVLWLGLAQACELKGDTSCAIAAAKQAVPLAPYYAQPHWQLGNILVRAGQAEEGFGELRLAAASNPTLLPAIIDLAWQLSRGNAQYVMRAVQPRTPAAYQAVAECFKKHGQVTDAIAAMRSAGSTADDYRRAYVGELLAAKRFADAYAVWSISHPLANESDAGGPIMSDPGFEQESNLDETGFGWRTQNKPPTVTLALDIANPKEGKSSLRVEFSGESDPGIPIISQLVLVEPNSRYQLHFVARTESIVSGGLPRVAVADAGNKEILGQTNAFPEAVSAWQDYTLDFGSHHSTGAVQITLQRERCTKSPCPIFGRLWLDNFSFRKL